MSYVRTRVASSDWCASRNVVSVISSRFCSVVHAAKPSGPSSCKSCRVPFGAAEASCGGATAAFNRFGTAFPATCGLPFTITSARYPSSFVARSCRGTKWNSALVSSSHRVLTFPAWKSGWFTTFSRNRMFVFTPRTRNSRRHRSILWQVCANSRPHAVVFTSSES